MMSYVAVMFKVRPTCLVLLTSLFFIALEPVAFAQVSCNSLDGTWRGTLGIFTDVELKLIPQSRPELKAATVKYLDYQHQKRNYNLGFANCITWVDGSVSIEFYQNANGAEIDMALMMKDESALLVPMFSVRASKRYDKVAGVLQKS